LPAVALQVVEKASDPECELESLTRIVSNDPGMSAMLLRTVNSAIFGLRQRVTSVRSALILLGIQPFRSLVLTLAMSRVRLPPLPPEMLKNYWRVSVAGGLAARQLAVEVGRSAPDNDLAVALLRDLGMLVLHQLYPARYKVLLNTPAPLFARFQCELEEEALELSHAEVSSEVLKAWRLPEDFSEPVRFHHDWVRAERLTGELGERARLLYLATQIGQLQLAIDQPQMIQEVATLAASSFGLTEPALLTFMNKVADQIKEFAGILGVDIGKVQDFSSLVNKGLADASRLATEETQRLGQHQLATPVREALGELQVAPTPVGNPAQLFFRESDKPQSSGVLAAFDGCTITEWIGSGALAAVFRALDLRMERTVALKMLLPQFADSPAMRQRFLEEGRAVVPLTHENLVRVFAVNESAGRPYLVMEHVVGEALDVWLKREAPLSLPDILRLGLQTASALAAVHAQGLVHGNLQPANLLVEKATGRIKMSDFGLARVLALASIDDDKGPVRAPWFLSPEEALGNAADARSDLFSLGAVLYVASTGQRPFRGETVQEVLEQICAWEPPLIRTLNAALPDWLEEVVVGLLNKDPGQRFFTASQLRQLFQSRWVSLYPASSARPSA
jgi:HD-like signal output (HDOD) protein